MPPPTPQTKRGPGLPGSESLRTSFIRIGVVVLIFSIGGYYLAESILRFLQRLTGVRLAAYGIPETFFSFLNLGLAFGVFASMPYILYAILAGVQLLYPTLNRARCAATGGRGPVLRRRVLRLNISLPRVQFLLSSKGLTSRPSSPHRSLYPLPAVSIRVHLQLPRLGPRGRIGIVTYQKLARNRRYAVLAITMIAAVLTPTPDAFNLAMMAVPLYLLFELGLFGMRFNSAAKRRGA
jgi:sec-independent protein translocase protein TatC